MAENVRPPVAIRIVRPYDTEDELLVHELETVGKTSVVLIGAHPRPTGVILRFEVTLASGATVLRGEGRVLAHKENAFRGQPGLTLRFTRLDPRSKSVVDRATAMREARSANEASSPSRPPPRAEGAVAEALTQSTPAPGPTMESTARTPASNAPPAVAPANADQEAAVANALASAREKANATARANAKRTGGGRSMGLTPPPVPAMQARGDRASTPLPAPREADATHAADAMEDSAPTPAPTPVTSVPGEVAEGPRVHRAAPPSPQRVAQAAASDRSERAVEPPPDRADLLARLRDRAGKLAPERVAEILSPRR